MTTAATKAPTPREVWRREAIRADREALSRLYFLHVVLPLTVEGYPRPKPEALLVPGRNYRTDYAYLSARLAVELDGGITGRRNTATGAWEHGKRGGHVSVSGYTRDRAKDNELVCQGWAVLRFTTSQIESGEALAWTRRALDVRRSWM